MSGRVPGLSSAIAAVAAVFLASCTSGKTYEGVAGTSPENRDTIFSNGGVGLTLFGGSKENAAAAAPVAVNAYLWRASLDTLAFMPLASADPFGGVIISEWFAPPETPDERFKVNVYILGPTLRADGLRISIFRQTRSGGVWNDAPVNAEMTTEFENAVLSRARDLRLRAVAEKD
ncbi:MAG: DUF3576 domain-containing protein [Rhodospirillaceae bacterium]